MVGKLGLLSIAAVAGVAAAQSKDYPGVVSANDNGPTNPDQPELGTDTPEDSEARLLTVNNIDVSLSSCARLNRLYRLTGFLYLRSQRR